MSAKNVVLFHLIIFMFCSCDFVKSVQKDAQNQIVQHKNFIKEISFSGLIIEKKYCNNCNFNKYQIIIDLKDLDVLDVELKNQSYPPYYTMDFDNKITLSVSQILYEFVDKGVEIKKESNSNILIIKGKSYDLLSDKKYDWIPNDGNAPN